MAVVANSSVSSFSRAPSFWLFALAIMVLGQVLLGGITRLSDSGLSIMEWAPIVGILPPFGDAEWNRLFEIYRGTGEYRLVNSTIDLDGFKSIFWWEYIHRLWARCLVPAFLLPFAWFCVKGRLIARWRWRLVGIFALGGLQGLLGWIMVASGFSDRTDVSQYRLVLHLLLALLIFAFLLWSALSLGSFWRDAQPLPVAAKDRLRSLGWKLLALVSMQIALGGFVAGLDAGIIYNSLPLMGSGIAPVELGATDPWWLDPFENPASAQFFHRIMSLVVTVAGLTLSWQASRAGEVTGAIWLAMAILLQIGLGVATLLLIAPLALAVLHQAGAFALLAVVLVLTHRWSRGAA